MDVPTERHPDQDRAETTAKSGYVRSETRPGILGLSTGPAMIGTGYKSIGERAQALLRHPYTDLHDAGILLHPTLHRLSRKPSLLLGGLAQKVLRDLRPGERRLTHPLDPGRSDFRHGADGSLWQGSDCLEVRNHGLHRLEVHVGSILDLCTNALCIGCGVFSDAKTVGLSRRGRVCDRLSRIMRPALCVRLRPLGSSLLFGPVLRFLTLPP